MTRTKVAVIGSGNIGTDLMIKVLRVSRHLEMGAIVGIDSDSDGLRRAQHLGVPTTADGVRGLLDMPEFDEITVVFDATSATAHLENARLLTPHGKALVDLVFCVTPSGPRGTTASTFATSSSRSAAADWSAARKT